MMAEEVKSLLAEVQLDSFFVKLRDNLQVTTLQHFENVKPHDLAGIGMSKPAIRRLLKALQERRASTKPGFKKFLKIDYPKASQDSTQSLACLITESDLTLGDKLGDGSFGVVKKAMWKKSGQYVAVKVLKRDLITNDQILEDFIREVNVMHNLDHKHLVKLHGVCLGPQHMMITELAPYGALLDYLHANHFKTLIGTLHLYACQLASAMAYLEQKLFIHRDIALRNIFLLTPEHVKLGDFGLARILSPNSNVYIMAPDRKVPYAWCAPESLKRREFTHAADAWMYAVTLWELFTFGQEPWMGFNGAQILEKIDRLGERLPRPDCCPTEIFQMMLQCWLPEPDDRPTFRAIFDYLTESHPVEMRVKRSFSEIGDKNKLHIQADDKVLIVDGRSDKKWWYGQNKRTMAFGYFPRSVLDPLRPLTCLDISKPLPSTFVHLGAGKGADNPAQLPEQSRSESPLNIQQQNDESSLNPTYLPCRKQTSASKRQFSEANAKPKNGATDFFPNKPNNNGLINDVNPFAVDVFMPELFDMPSQVPVFPNGKPQSVAVALPASVAPVAAGQPRTVPNHVTAQSSRPISQPVELRQNFSNQQLLSKQLHNSNISLIDRSTAHYDYLPQPLLPLAGRASSAVLPNGPLLASRDAGSSHNFDPFVISPAVRNVVGSTESPLSANNNTPAPVSDGRSRRSAPVDGQIPFVSQENVAPVQPAVQSPSAGGLYSAAGDLMHTSHQAATLSSHTTFTTMHSQLANIFGVMRPSHSSTAVSSQDAKAIPSAAAAVPTSVSSVPQPLFVRLPPPENHPRSGTRKITPPQVNSAVAAASPSSSSSSSCLSNVQQIKAATCTPAATAVSNNIFSQPSSQNAVGQPVPPLANVTTQAVVHKSSQPAAPLLPGNYRTAKFLEMASLSPARQQQSSQNDSPKNSKKSSSKYSKTAEIMPQLRGTLELAQARRMQAEQDRPQKLQQLLDLGLASEEICRNLLMKHNWDVEKAGSELAERTATQR